MLLRRRATFCSIALATALAAPALCQDRMSAETSAPASTVDPASLSGIADIALRVKDVAASVDFYHKLGFDHPFDRKSGDTLIESFISFIKINDTQFVELYPVSAADPRVGFLRLCFQAADLNALHDAYANAGLAPTAVHTDASGNQLFTLPGPAQSNSPAQPSGLEFTQYRPGSLHAKDAGQHLGPDRVGDKITVVALAVQDPAAARSFYQEKLGFHPSAASPARLDLPGGSGESIEIVPAAQLGTRASIVVNSPDIDKAAAQLTRQQVPFQRAASTSTDAAGKTHTLDMLAVTDPDGNVIRIAQTK